MKIKTVLLSTMLLFSLILAVTAVFLFITFQRIDNLNNQEEIARGIERTARELSYLSNDYLLHRENEGRERWLTKSASLSSDLDRLNIVDPEQVALVNQIRANQKRLQSVFLDVVSTVGDNSLTGSDQVDLEVIQVSWSRLEVQNQGIIFAAALLSQKMQDQEDQVRETSMILVYALAGVFAIYLLANYFMIYQRTLRSLERLRDSTKIIGSGNLSYVIADTRNDEIGELSRAFNGMTTSLREITASKADLEREISDRQQAEAALRISEARLRRLVEGNLIGVFTRDERGGLGETNEAFRHLLGYSDGDLQSSRMNLLDLVPGEDQEAEKHWMETAASCGPSRSCEKVYLRKDGQRVPVLVGETQLESEPTEFIGFVLDLSELKQAQAAMAAYADKLKHSNQELEQFAFIASHDLQEPLRKVRSFGDRLVKSLGDDLQAEPREYITRMQNAVERMQAMIDDLLELSRVGRRGESFQMVALSELAAEALSDLSPRIQMAHGQVVVGLLPEIEADPLQMRRLLQNLIGNALKYHKPDVAPVVKVWGGVETARTAEDPTVTICVEDNGIGFSEEYLEHIFQPFTRLHGRSEYEGTGMGLAICKKIVERHRGSITARSQPGEGATFIVTLPAHQGE